MERRKEGKKEGKRRGTTHTLIELENCTYWDQVKYHHVFVSEGVMK